MTTEARNGHEDPLQNDTEEDRLTMPKPGASTTSNGYIHRPDDPSAKVESNALVNGHTREEIDERTQDESDEVGPYVV